MSTVGKNKTENNIKFLKQLPTLLIVLFTILFVIMLMQEFFAFDNQAVASSFLSKPNIIFIDVIFVAIAITIICLVNKFCKKLISDLSYANYSQNADIPMFILTEKKSLVWNNFKNIEYLSTENPQQIVSMIFDDKESDEKLDDCLKSGKSTFYEKTLKFNNQSYWFHITLKKVDSNKNFVSCVLSDISNMKEANERIDNQQRELQMQAEMLSLITAQMEVQQAGIKEQNELLSAQHKQLEQQARMLQDANDELEYRNKQIITKTSYITDSIKYAQTIQEAMLPAANQLETNFFNNFIIYKPKDIVSGDFYWYSVTNEYVFAVLGDCTGHGVPGAFMSMIGTRILGELINENKMDIPSVILETMHERIVAALKQDETENNDGMDIAICRIKKLDNQSFELKYAGAKQPIFIKRKDTDEVEQVPADRRGIGGHSYANFFFFEDRDYTLNSGDRIYLTTDGIKDQNNMLRKRFGTKRLEMMLSITSTTDIRDQIVSNWQGLEEQRDDISLWGIELSGESPKPNDAII